MSIRKLKNHIVQVIEANIPKNLSYHGVHHTLSVVDVCNQYIRRVKMESKQAHLLRTGALLHDIGIMWDYHNHEEKGVAFVRKTLPGWGYSPQDIEVVTNLILSTRVPQKPKTFSEQIICDADLDYLGTDQFYPIGETLYKEFIEYNIVSNREEWDRLQVNFLTNHNYHTPFAKKHREPIKLGFLKEIKEKWGWE